MKKEEREKAPDMAAAGLIRNTSGKFGIVSREGLWSLPIGHKDRAKGDRIQRDTFFREMEEELELKKEQILYIESLGNVPLQKDKQSSEKLAEVFYAEISDETAKRLRYKEGDEHILVWLKEGKIMRLTNRDALLDWAIRTFRQRSCRWRGGCYEGGRSSNFEVSC